MALYRGMDIGTAKPTAEERRLIPHHLIDIIDPSEEFSVAQYLEAATAAANDISALGREVLFVGGTALYLKALLRGLFSGPPANWRLRRELEETARVEGPAALHARLAQIDPTAATKLHPNDVRRIIRALEVHETIGQPISSLQQQFAQRRPADQCKVFVLDWPRDALEDRARLRVDAMFAAGLVEEVTRIATGRTGRLSRTASQALGHREVLEYLNGQRGLAATIELVKLRTRQFAKRQLTWFRSLSECRWISVCDPLAPAEVAQRIAAAGQQSNLPR